MDTDVFDATSEDTKDDQLKAWLAQNIGNPPAGSSTNPSLAPKILGAPSTPTAAGGNPPLPPPDTKADNNPDDKIADSHPGLQPGELDQYIKGQEQQTDKFGPEQQAALMQHLQQSYKSPGNLLAKGGATLADAIMQGVSRAGSSGNLAAINEREKANLDRTAEMGKSLNEQQQAALKVKQELEAKSGNTPLGASQSPMLAMVLSAVGVSKDRQAAILANPEAAKSILPAYMEFMATHDKLKLENAVKEIELKLQGQRNDIEAGRVNTEAKLGQQGKDIEAKRAAQEAAKTIAGGSIIPGIGPSHAQKEAALKTLSGAIPGQGQSFDTEEQAEAANLPPGTIVTIGGRQARVK